MRAAIALAFAAALALMAAPEFARYGAERRVGVATAAFRELVSRENVDLETARRIRAVGELALSATQSLPGDPRPWMIGASSYLVTGQPRRALEFYRAALATGERAEVDLNLGRAYARLGQAEAAEAAYLRAGWVSPEILETLPEPARRPLLDRIARLTETLRAGKLPAPPPLPPDSPAAP